MAKDVFCRQIDHAGVQVLAIPKGTLIEIGIDHENPPTIIFKEMPETGEVMMRAAVVEETSEGEESKPETQS